MITGRTMRLTGGKEGEQALLMFVRYTDDCIFKIAKVLGVPFSPPSTPLPLPQNSSHCVRPHANLQFATIVSG